MSACENTSLFYTTKGNRYKLPSKKAKEVIDLPIEGDLENWPAHSSTQSSSTLIRMTKDKRMKITSLRSSFGKQQKPKFLHYLESYVQREIRYRNVSASGISKIRLDIYRGAFDYIIEAFNSYKSILSDIKREYEMMLDHYARRITYLEPMTEKLYIFAADCDRKIIQTREAEKEGYEKLLIKNTELKETITDLEGEIESLKHQIEVVKASTADAYYRYREERDARLVMVMARKDEEVDYKGEQVEQIARDEMIKYKIALTEAKNAQGAAIRRVAELEARFSDVVPRSECVYYQELVEELRQKVTTLETERLQLLNDKKEIQRLCDMAVEERDAHYMRLMQSETGSMHNWMICVDFIGSLLSKWLKAKLPKKFDDVVNAILNDIIIEGTGRESVDEEDTEEKSEKDVEAIKASLDADSLCGARLLAEMVANILTGERKTLETKKSATKEK